MDPEYNPSSVPSTTPRVSVVIPCYNCAETLQPSLNSITNQTFRSLEIIAVDDGSNDATLEILKNSADDDQRIRVITDKHMGIVSALNAGIGECRAPIIARMDADDIAHPTRIEKQAAFLERHPGIALVGCLVEAFPLEGVGHGFQLYLEWMNALTSHE